MGFNCLSSIFSVCITKKKTKRDIKRNEDDKSSDFTVISNNKEDLSDDIIDAYSKTTKKDVNKKKKSGDKSLSKLRQNLEHKQLDNLEKSLESLSFSDYEEKFRKKNKEKSSSKTSKKKKEEKKKKKGKKEIILSQSSEDFESEENKKRINSKNKTKKSAKNRTFLSKDDLESIKKRSLDFDSESEICFLVNEAQQQKFNKSLYKKMKAYLINKEMSKKTK
ncbi:hypothetical protein AAJ76_2000147654 [Vairimorpha ceranae]|uniref:Uncharacterized protein n=1 Tax=Vairimorpha ceranae TaxID=40302 RepID=A0A0F9WV27_9MICR|nr:hypothetical protein AAJ76_2000147654 [Vairimorpha ceranae]KAF5141345.1 hypothetical protein G9O61_00g006620 [Vairimorpha ceranae]KKO76588.1 hypothetical protein AAJ76_2000147654 [Vairimorpha ceranae]